MGAVQLAKKKGGSFLDDAGQQAMRDHILLVGAQHETLGLEILQLQLLEATDAMALRLLELLQ